MARVLSISSQVVRGHVGNSAAAFALQRLGHEVWILPTVVQSNHPGHAHVAGTRISPEALRDMAGALAKNGWLGEVDAVLTGYLPTAEHVDFAAETIARLRELRPNLLVVVDPVLGDDPGGLYVAEAAAARVRERLLPLADVLTPNRFELAWLSRAQVSDAASAVMAASGLGASQVVATSIPDGSSGNLVNLLWQPGAVSSALVPRLATVPHGTGDLLAALHLARLLHGASAPQALRLAVAGVAAVIEASAGADELRLIGSQNLWAIHEV